jgi:hypothetical protein
MKLWLITRKAGDCDYDEHGGAVIAAETAEDARAQAVEALYPRVKSERGGRRERAERTWAEAELLELVPDQCARGIVLAEFNAG